MKPTHLLIALLIAFMASVGTAFSQYEDDAYLTPSKAKELREKQEKEYAKRLQAEKQRRLESQQVIIKQQKATAASENELVDFYNRRGQKRVTIEAMEENLDQLDGDKRQKSRYSGTYGKRLRRFHSDGQAVVINNVDKVYILDDMYYDPFNDSYYGYDNYSNVSIHIGWGDRWWWNRPYYRGRGFYSWMDSWYYPWYDPYYYWSSPWWRPYYPAWGYVSPYYARYYDPFYYGYYYGGFYGGYYDPYWYDAPYLSYPYYSSRTYRKYAPHGRSALNARGAVTRGTVRDYGSRYGSDLSTYRSTSSYSNQAAGVRYRNAGRSGSSVYRSRSGNTYRSNTTYRQSNSTYRSNSNNSSSYNRSSGGYRTPTRSTGGGTGGVRGRR